LTGAAGCGQDENKKITGENGQETLKGSIFHIEKKSF